MALRGRIDSAHARPGACAGLCEEISLLIMGRKDIEAGTCFIPKDLLEGITGKGEP